MTSPRSACSPPEIGRASSARTCRFSPDVQLQPHCTPKCESLHVRSGETPTLFSLRRRRHLHAGLTADRDMSLLRLPQQHDAGR